MKITKSQLKSLIKEEVSRFKKIHILENRKRKIQRELIYLNESNEIIAEGATIGIDGLFADKKDLSTILDICWVFRDIAWEEVPNARIEAESFSPDGSSYDKETGIVNFYPSMARGNNFDKEGLTKVLKAIKIFSEDNGLVLGKITAETGRPESSFGYEGEEYKGPINYVKGEPINKIRVIRIPIVKNNSFNTGLSQNNIGMSYSSVHNVFGEILGFPLKSGQYVFNFKTKEVKDRIEKARRENKSFYISSTQRDYAPYINIIYDMAKYAVENGYETMGGA
jgi:hypothetical protein